MFLKGEEKERGGRRRRRRKRRRIQCDIGERIDKSVE
jgi:hypothetical protein